MKKLLIIVFIAILIIISNFVYGIRIGASYEYSTIDNQFQFTCIPSKGRDVETMERQFTRFKQDNPEHKDLIIYRKFRAELWKFWLWGEYFSNLDWWWPYPYLQPDE